MMSARTHAVLLEIASTLTTHQAVKFLLAAIPFARSIQCVAKSHGINRALTSPSPNAHLQCLRTINVHKRRLFRLAKFHSHSSQQRQAAIQFH